MSTKPCLLRIKHDDSPRIGAANNNLHVVLDIDTILGLSSVLTLLDGVKSLIKFAKSHHDVYVVAYIEALKILWSNLFHTMHCDGETWFNSIYFHVYDNVANNTSCKNTRDWDTDLNTNFDDHVQHFHVMILEQSNFTFQINPYTFVETWVTQDGFHKAQVWVKNQCVVAIDMSIYELKRRFPLYEFRVMLIRLHLHASSWSGRAGIII